MRSGEAAVPTAVFQVVQAELATLKAELKQYADALEEADDIKEVLERKVDSLGRVRESDAKAHRAELAKVSKERHRLHGEIDAKSAEIKELRDSNMKLRRLSTGAVAANSRSSHR